MTAQEAREVRRQFNEADRLRVVLARQVVNAMTEGEVDGDVSVIFAPLFAECLGILRQEVGR